MYVQRRSRADRGDNLEQRQRPADSVERSLMLKLLPMDQNTRPSSPSRSTGAGTESIGSDVNSPTCSEQGA